ncbi:xylan 1,4-beta-xylosidase [Aureococcus anophagefferens]|nr:xylan 1,4-beta-xylosidase [Aureococcus anophagefferens]
MGDYSAAGWSGGAPSGGGNIDTFNMVPVLEGLRKAPRSDVVYAVGSSLSAARHWNVVQRHEWAVAAAFAATAPSVPYAPGFEPTTAGRAYDVAVNYSQSHSWNDGPAVALLWSLAEDDDDDELAKAKRAMDAADAVVAVVGGANNLRAPDGGNDSTEGEGVDRASLALTGRQRDLVDAAPLASKSGAAAVVLVDGKPTAEPLLKTAPAVLAAFNGGQAQGDAIAAVLVGAANPSGRLPLSFPASADVLPVFYDRKPSSARSGWCDVAESVLWAFGHGLSYSNVTYADVSVVPETASAATDEVLVRFTLAHAGGPPVVEVPQVYVRDVVSSVTTPLRSLKAFARVDLAPGETRRVELAISLDELRVLDRTMAWVLEPGTFEVYVGPASDDTPLSASFDVVSD